MSAPDECDAMQANALWPVFRRDHRNSGRSSIAARYYGDRPWSFQTGKGILAYVDNMGDFKVFTNGEITTVMTMTPDKYLVEDNLVIFEQQGQLKTYCNGEIKVIERYMPANYKADLNTIAYIDENQNIKAFANCTTLGITYEKVKSLEIYRDLIYFQSGVQTHNIIYNGKAYVY